MSAMMPQSPPAPPAAAPSAEAAAGGPSATSPAAAAGAETGKRKLTKREMVIEEMLQTEGVYVKKLSTVIEVFMKPLRDKRILDDEQIKLQFSSCETILSKHNTLHSEFTHTSFDEVGRLFKSFSGELHVYEDYLVNFDIALTKRAALLMNNRKFAAFVEAARNDPACQGQALESYLIAPVQRIPRYRLLLEQLLKYTSDTHPDHGNIVDALATIQEVAMAHNEAIRRRETKDKLMDIMMRFDFRCRVNLLEGERLILREGVLSKQCRRGVKDFTFWVFSDEILYGEQQIPGVGYYTSSRVISFAACRVSPARNIANAEKAFLLESPAKSFIVWTKSPEESVNWMDEIGAAMRKHKSSRDEETGKIAPVWTPDSDVTQCELCNKPFSLINRRHHCRNCGGVVCDACSRKRYLVSHIDRTKQSRVCDPCFIELMELEANGRSGVASCADDVAALAARASGGSGADSPATVEEGAAGTSATAASGGLTVNTSAKSNLPKRGRQSVILRGLDNASSPTATSGDSSAACSPTTSSQNPNTAGAPGTAPPAGGAASSTVSSTAQHSRGTSDGAASSPMTTSPIRGMLSRIGSAFVGNSPSTAPLAPSAPFAATSSSESPEIDEKNDASVSASATAVQVPSKPAKPRPKSTTLDPSFGSSHAEVEKLTADGRRIVENPLRMPKPPQKPPSQIEQEEEEQKQREAATGGGSAATQSHGGDSAVGDREAGENGSSSRPGSTRLALPVKPVVPKKPTKMVKA